VKNIWGTCLLILSGLLIYASIQIFIQPIPTDEELVTECNQLILSGSYQEFPEEEKLIVCLEDSYKAAGLAPILKLVVGLLFLLLSAIPLRYGLRVFGREKKLDDSDISKPKD
jgi:hypothetical protein